MPTAPLRPCPRTGCSALTHGGYCEVHAPNRAHGWAGNGATRIRGRRLQRLRDQLFTREPLCRACTVQGRTTIAVIRDHIVPMKEGGTDETTNIQPLCQACSDTKTLAESKRGMTRSRG